MRNLSEQKITAPYNIIDKKNGNGSQNKIVQIECTDTHVFAYQTSIDN